MKYLSLFSGIGGFELGIQQAYEKLCIENESFNRSSDGRSQENTQRDDEKRKSAQGHHKTLTSRQRKNPVPR